jgi:predicted ester cyclase
MTNRIDTTDRPATTTPGGPAADPGLRAVEERNDATMRRFYAEVFGRGRLDLLEDFMVPEVVNHTAPPEGRHGLDAVRALVTTLRTAFPDGAMEVEETLARGDTVVMRNWFAGTHLGPFRGAEPTGRRFRFRQVHWMRFGADGRVVEHWGVRDDLTHLRQLGLTPE